jgi:spore germination protein GerM
MMKYRGLAAMMFCVVALFLFSGCAVSDSGPTPNNKAEGAKVPEQAPKAAEPAKVTEDTVPVKVYFGTHDARYLVAEVRLLKKDAQLKQRAMDALTAGPRQPDLVAVVPASTKVKSVVVRDRTATVDFSSEIVTRGFGGSSKEILAVGAIVNTLTEFPDVERVQILVDGKKVDTLFGHLDVSDLLSRSPDIIKQK